MWSRLRHSIRSLSCGQSCGSCQNGSQWLPGALELNRNHAILRGYPTPLRHARQLRQARGLCLTGSLRMLQRPRMGLCDQRKHSGHTLFARGDVVGTASKRMHSHDVIKNLEGASAL
jgi:hypothetical protein